MQNLRTTIVVAVLAIAGAIVGIKALAQPKLAQPKLVQPRLVQAHRPAAGPHALKAITFNTHAYGVEHGKTDKRSMKITAEEQKQFLTR